MLANSDIRLRPQAPLAAPQQSWDPAVVPVRLAHLDFPFTGEALGALNQPATVAVTLDWIAGRA